MCRIEGCERHEFTSLDALCLEHFKEALAPAPKRKSRKKKVDTVEVTTNDDTTELETREAQ